MLLSPSLWTLSLHFPFCFLGSLFIVVCHFTLVIPFFCPLSPLSLPSLTAAGSSQTAQLCLQGAVPCSAMPTAGSRPRFPVGSPAAALSVSILTLFSAPLLYPFLIVFAGVHQTALDLPYVPSIYMQWLDSMCLTSLSRASSSSLLDVGSVLAEPFSSCGRRCVTPTCAHALVPLLYGPQAVAAAPGLCASPSATVPASRPSLAALSLPRPHSSSVAPPYSFLSPSRAFPPGAFTQPRLHSMHQHRPWLYQPLLPEARG